MQYDENLITKKTIIRDGVEYEIEVIPTGMSGANVTLPYTKEYDDEDEGNAGEISNINKENIKEYTDYINEGLDPDSDEIREIKNKIERDHSYQLLDEVIEEADL